jgi:hypothetical protein
MNVLKEFNNDYMYNNMKEYNDEFINSSDKYRKITKTIISNCPISPNKTISINIPILSDLFIGICNDNNIKSVTYILNKIEINAKLISDVWKISELPFPLHCMKRNININVNISYNVSDNTSDNTSNINCIYGILDSKSKKLINNNPIFEYKDINIVIVCGMIYNLNF